MILPGELTDIVIDFCHADESSLLVCSLVCKSWTSRSRCHLLGTPKALNRLINARNALAFNNLLVSPHCSLIPHLLRLNIQYDPPKSHRAGLEEVWKTLHSYPSLSLKVLHLSDVLVDDLPKTFLPHSTSSLKTLYLKGCDGVGQTTSSLIVLRISDYVNVYKSLEDLTLDYQSAGCRISFVDPRPKDLEGGPKLCLPHLRRLSFNSAFGVFLPMFASVGFIQCPRLTHVHLRVPISVDQRALQQFLDAVCASRVELLEISFKYSFRHVRKFFPSELRVPTIPSRTHS
ncbi:hypothetical protein PM082_015209 [Marasmius tenuissimus]|nr:hypothetical protein PM082_015209 [Marasmius tenuissimus]